MGIEKITGKLAGALESASKSVRKIGTKSQPSAVEGGTKKLQGTLDSISATMRAKIGAKKAAIKSQILAAPAEKSVKEAQVKISQNVAAEAEKTAAKAPVLEQTLQDTPVIVEQAFKESPKPDAVSALKKAVEDAKKADEAKEQLKTDVANAVKLRQLGIIKDATKSAEESAQVFIEAGKSPIEKALDAQERQAELALQQAAKKQELLAQQAEKKKELLAKHADEFVRKHPELKDSAKLQEFISKLQ